MRNRAPFLSDEQLPPIAVGILNYNRCAEALTTLDMLCGVDYPAHKIRLILIDNASADATVEAVRERFGDRVEIVAMPFNAGASARNVVMLGCDEPYIFMFDEDSAPERPETIRRVIEFMEFDRYFGAFCFHVRNLHSGELEFGDVERIARRRRADGAYEAIRVVGAGMCYRRDAIRRANGYDERIFWGGEEHDLALRMTYYGIPIALRPDLAIVHRQAPRAFSPSQVNEIVARNDLWISFRYFPMPVAVLVSALHTLRWWGAAAAKRDWERARGVLRGTRRGIERLNEIMPDRMIIPVSTLAGYGRWFVRMLNIFP